MDTLIAKYRKALKDILEGARPYSQDPFNALKHCSNTVEVMKAIAHEALENTLIDHDHSIDPPVWSCCGSEIQEGHPKCPMCS